MLKGFWIKEKIGTEQPIIQFQYRYIILIETDKNVHLSSSFDNLNQIYSNEFLPVVRTVRFQFFKEFLKYILINFHKKVYESDSNNDGAVDTLQVSFLMSGLEAETVQDIKILLLFNTTLSVSTFLIQLHIIKYQLM